MELMLMGSAGALIALGLFVYTLMQPYVRGLYKLRGPPSSSLLLGLAADLGGIDWDRGNYPQPIVRYAREYGMVYYNRLFHMHRMAMMDPVGLKHILVTRSDIYPRCNITRTLFQKLARGVGLLSAEGAVHDRMRKQLHPHFTPVQIKSFLPIFEQHAKAFLGHLPPSTPIDLLERFTQLALDVIGVTAFGFAFNAIQGTRSDEIRACEDCKIPISILANVGAAYLPYWDSLPLPWVARQRAAKDVLQQIVTKVIDAKLASPKTHTARDLLDLMLLSDVSAADARVHAATFLQAGHETTSNTLAWVVVTLTAHPEMAERVHCECHAVLARHPTGLTSDAVGELVLLTACIHETLRLYPTAPTLSDRIATQDNVVPLMDGDSFFVPKGTQVGIDVLAIHRNPRFWTDPDAFLPGWRVQTRSGREIQQSVDRFVEGHALQRADKALRGELSQSFFYLPFSTGDKNCIGQRFALLEMQVALVYLLGTFRVHLTPRANVCPKRDLTTMHPTLLEVTLTAL
ncbi:hypothetical protein SDRG_02962 [Saprolegnia diclina VS20]|uniref:Cytochrome P450 n=1 Tax=Saprolegnia diclina (strain VS20) TaxID=1156394 RepID=T0QN80_SAPDV|nr:hypothetical protein SDRG_02962 [Saprolegnia diclina VS20]EQC39524.1 hypothetical protein SDRG_02962 [Saprolegnia diclina VS20]|eukprot:XP_008606796.1 hypothetical protein SDRG_02962 [Saprolegnia diclina VS20]